MRRLFHQGGWILAALLSGPNASSIAADNVLGLPSPDNPRRPGALVLHGGGKITDDVFARFVELAGGKEARIVLVPCAGYRVGDYDSEGEFLSAMNRRFSAWVGLERAEQIRSFQFLYTDDPADADDKDFVDPMANATGVWFSGGFQGRLNYRFVGEYPKQTRFQEALRAAVERGGVVGGTSAGTAALPEIMTMWDGADRTGGPLSVVAAHGFGLLRGAIMEQHFATRSGRLERFTGLLRDDDQLNRLTGREDAGANMVGLGVEEQTALVLRGDRLETIGNGGAHVFLKSHDNRVISWHELRSGESADIHRDPRGDITLRRLEIASKR